MPATAPERMFPLKITTKEIVTSALFAALTAVFSQLAVPLPFSPVPISLSLFAVFVCGAVLDMRAALLSQIVYVALGAVGVPVFAGFSGGLLRPTGGYLLAYPLVALLPALAGRLARGRKPRVRILLTAVSILPALFLCYACGCMWFAAYTHQSVAASIGLTVLPFVPFDLVKGAAAVAVAVPVRRAVRLMSAHAA